MNCYDKGVCPIDPASVDMSDLNPPSIMCAVETRNFKLSSATAHMLRISKDAG